jgi:sugar O-acyltransferase (sialic acid O-acetyltransferase NeuD family)
MNMENIIIFGTSDFCRLIHWYLESDSKFNVIGFTVHSKFIKHKEFQSLPVYPFEEMDILLEKLNFKVLIAIGNSKMNTLRESVFKECKSKGLKIASYYHPSSKINSHYIGEGNIILENCILYPFSTIGDNNLLWDNVIINHDCTIGSHNTFAGHSDLNGYSKIGNNCFIGKKAIIKEYINISDYTLIGAGVFCDFNTRKYDVVVPCRAYRLKNKKSIDLM